MCVCVCACVRVACLGVQYDEPALTHSLAAAISLGQMKHSEVLSKCVLLSLSRAWGLGRAVLRARREQRTPHEAVVESQNGRLLMTGKVGCCTQCICKPVCSLLTLLLEVVLGVE